VLGGPCSDRVAEQQRHTPAGRPPRNFTPLGDRRPGGCRRATCNQPAGSCCSCGAGRRGCCGAAAGNWAEASLARAGAGTILGNRRRPVAEAPRSGGIHARDPQLPGPSFPNYLRRNRLSSSSCQGREGAVKLPAVAVLRTPGGALLPFDPAQAARGGIGFPHREIAT